VPTFNWNDRAVHYLDEGAGEPLVLLHPASPPASGMWRKVFPYLADERRLLAPDLLGFGQTSAWTEATPLMPQNQAQLVQAFIAKVCDAPVHLVGHSYGGAAAVRAALMSSGQIRSLTVIEPLLMPLLAKAGETELFEGYKRMVKAFISNAQADRKYEAWRNFVDYWNGDGSWESMSDKAKESMLPQTETALVGMPGNLRDTTSVADLHRLELPTLVVCGEKSAPLHRRLTSILSQEIPHCKHRLIAEAGHMSILTHPEEIAAVIKEHLAANT